MNASKIAARIAALEATLTNDADVISVEQRASINRALAALRGNPPVNHDRRSGVCERCGHTFADCNSADQCNRNLAKSTPPAPTVINVTPVHPTKADSNVIQIPAGFVPRTKHVDRPVPPVPPAGSKVIDAAPVETDSKPTNTVPRVFLTAGKATFTFTSISGEHFTFLVERPEKFRGEFFGSVMKGTDNETDFRYVGMVHEASLTIRGTKGSKFAADSKEFKVFARALDIVAGRKALPAGYSLLRSEQCGRCGRKLTNPTSIDNGIGPECADRLAAAA